MSCTDVDGAVQFATLVELGDGSASGLFFGTVDPGADPASPERTVSNPNGSDSIAVAGRQDLLTVMTQLYQMAQDASAEDPDATMAPPQFDPDTQIMSLTSEEDQIGTATIEQTADTFGGTVHLTALTAADMDDNELGPATIDFPFACPSMVVYNS
jgi:hypothetical protein